MGFTVGAVLGILVGIGGVGKKVGEKVGTLEGTTVGDLEGVTVVAKQEEA